MIGITLSLFSLAIAQDVDPAGESPAVQEEAVSADTSLETARAELEALQEATAVSGQHSAALQALLEGSATLLDDRQDLVDREAAAAALAAGGDERAIPFLRAAAMSRDPGLQLSALGAMQSFSPQEAASLNAAVATGGFGQSLQEEAISFLQAQQHPEAALRLWAIAGDGSEGNRLRAEALDALRESYPAFLAEKGDPQGVRGIFGSMAAAAANGVAGGFALNSVGVWGKTEAGEVIGGIGGSVIGVGTGALYAIQNPVSDGQGLYYASGIATGLTAGTLAGLGVSGKQYGEDRRNLEAALRLAGLGAGGWYTFKNLDRNPSVSDVLEMDGATYLGAQLAVGIADLVRDHKYPEEIWRGYEDHTEEEREAYYQEEFEAEHWDTGVDSVMALAGMAAGLGVGHVIVEDWNPTFADLGVAGVLGVEGALVGILLPPVLYGEEGWDRMEGTARSAIHAAAIGGLAYGHRHGVEARHAGIGAYGLVMGNVFGQGIAMLSNPDNDNEERVIQAGTLIGGVLGTPLAIRAADHTEWNAGDVSMIGVGLGLAAWESAALAYIADEKWDLYADSIQVAGTIETAISGAGLGLAVLAHRIDPDPANMLFLGTSTAWGAYYGALIPVALDTEGTAPDYVLTILTASNLALAAGAFAVSEKGFLDATDTLLPQLGGVAGATLGSLAVALGTEEGAAVATGALAGSTLGIVGGALWTRSRKAKGKEAVTLNLPVPHLSIPGSWGMTVQPMPGENGDITPWVGLTGRGF
jgi:hypothetical protein